METLPALVRRFVFDHFLEHAAPPVVEQLMAEFSLGREEATDVLRGLEAARHIALVTGTARILMAFPFSAVATPFRVTARGRTYFANCAWDAIAYLRLGGASRDARLLCPAADAMVGEHHHHVLEHDGLLRLGGASRCIGPVCVGGPLRLAGARPGPCLERSHLRRQV